MDDTSLREIRAAIVRMLPAEAVASTGAVGIAGTPAKLTIGELASTSRMSSRRLQEFSAGRSHARTALQQLGMQSPEIPVGHGRAPRWPAGCVGSISHAGDIVVAVAARSTALRAIGIDLEPAVPLDADLVHRICRPEELGRLVAWGAPSQLAKLVFSAKESVYKCVAPLTGAFLEFEDVEILFEPRDQKFRARGHGPAAEMLAPLTLAGAFAEAGGYWLTAAWLTQPADRPQE